MRPSLIRAARVLAALLVGVTTTSLGVTTAASAVGTLSHTSTSTGATPITAGRDAWVAVSVARLWKSPSSPRAVDRPALSRPVHYRAWLGAMSLDERRALYFLSDSEAIFGERVRVTAVRDRWAHVVIPDQPTPKDSRGYPGWVPARQLTQQAQVTADQVATVTRRTTWLRTDDARHAKVVEISFGTVLPVRGSRGSWVRVTTPLGAVRRVPVGAVSVHDPEASALPRTRADLVTTAQRFTGLPYLWGGLSGFGFDCSGLTWADYRAHGRVIPRDAAPQSHRGTPVARDSLRRGDLIFYATNGRVHHVTMYAGRGRMVESPHTGAVVRTVPVRSYEYDGARRLLH